MKLELLQGKSMKTKFDDTKQGNIKYQDENSFKYSFIFGDL